MFEVRKLLPEDRAVILPRMLELVDEERRGVGSLINPGPPSFYEQFFEPAGAAWTAFEGESLRGFGLLGFSPLVPALWLPYIAAIGADRRECGILFSTIVVASCRGRGLGTALYRRRIRQAREKGIEHLFALVHPGNAASRRLLGKHGFSTIDRLASYEEAGPRLVAYRPLAAGGERLPAPVVEGDGRSTLR